jgi:hypothetical protein
MGLFMMLLSNLRENKGAAAGTGYNIVGTMGRTAEECGGIDAADTAAPE